MTLEQLRATWPTSTERVGDQDVEIVRTTGKGRPVIFLPGAQGTAETFYQQLLAWGGQRPLVCVTFPALTDGAELADFTIQLADAVGIEVFDLVGTSLGGYIAQWMAVRHPRRLHRVVVGNSFQDPTPLQSADRLQELQQQDAAALKAEVLARVQASPESVLKSVQLALIGQGQPAELLRSRMLAVQLASTVPALGISDEQLLLVECDNDPLIKAPVRQAIRERYAGAKSVVIEGGGHYPYIIRPVAYNAAISAFLEL